MPDARLDEALQRSCIEMIRCPGTFCPRRRCRRRRRCSVGSAAPPPCLALLTPPERQLYDRLLAKTRYYAPRLSALVTAHIGATARQDVFALAVAECLRRIQPRTHWLHRALPFWANRDAPDNRNSHDG
ncbi:hypothetical protein [Pararhizobium gei]|uniref:hypothetical protein n=1 Tax=Pararhizobium gei TaxID=1395951 RepID=UPI0023DA0851|nr:hypothetical protein [Rhizobium gei]